ncbi:MAG TPA: hypothetical protein VGI03_02700 [Verrucomicrobiae bacterium]|jgi:hypothetical protein
MNFGKLLAAGKSIVNGRAEVAYRADKQFYLPKFGPAKNPFTKTPAESSPAPAKTEPPAAPKTLPVPAPAPAAAKYVSQPYPVAAPRQAQPTMNGVPVAQPELSLDMVKVVHNDLSDADVEVVPLKSRSGAPDLPPAKKSWEILGERLLKVTAL